MRNFNSAFYCVTEWKENRKIVTGTNSVGAL